jgi:LacI family transcriptional regulator
VSDITNPFFADLVRGIEAEAGRQQTTHNIILCDTEENAELERRTLDLVLEKRIDGIVMVPTGGNEAYLADLAQGDVPVVFADRSISGVDVDSVVVNNRETSTRLANHLLSLGHKRIGVLRARLNASAIAERLEGFLAAVDASGATRHPELIVEAPSTIEDAAKVASTLLSLDDRPTAIFCTNNFMTLGAMQAVIEHGLSCPDDVAIVGFDDFPWATAFSPRLTVVAQPARAMGEEAARLLFDRIAARRGGPPIGVVLSATMIVRDSCGVGRRTSASTAA